ncbi:MAG: DUF2244 domain-containing protein [Paracoccaceae bacterium]
MPYQWLPSETGTDDSEPRRMQLWPHRSLPRQGFVLFIGGTSALIALPLLTVVGSPVLWGLLPFLVLAVAGVWWALQRSYRDAEILEELTLTPAHMTLTRQGPRGAHAAWEANPHWVQVELHAKGGPVENYLTLRGAGRQVEIGAFLSVEERTALSQDLTKVLSGLR